MPKRNLTKQELLELEARDRIIREETWKLEQVKNNEGAVSNSKKVIRQMTELLNLYKGIREAWVSEKIYLCGYPKDKKYKIDLKTGKIKEVKNEKRK